MKKRDIFWFWLPLFASWLLMTAEGPINSATINRLPNEVVMLAAYGIVLSLSVTIESPIINLLSTSTAVVKDRPSYELVKRFTIHWSILLTVVSVLVSFTPFFDVVVFNWLDTPTEIGEWVRPGMQIMVLWSAAIAWRRFLQGVLIHFGYTRLVAWGTAVRLVFTAGTIISLSLFTNWAGIINGACALMAGVTSEAIYATIAIQPLFKKELAPHTQQGELMSYSELFWFHLPLAGTAVLVLLVQPLVTFTLARLDNPTITLAAWPVLFQIMLLARAAALALPEVVITLYDGKETFAPLRQFSLIITAVVTLFLILFTFTPLADWYIFTVQDMETTVGVTAQEILPLFIFFPALSVITAWLRGLLIAKKETKAVNIGMGINLVITFVLLMVGLSLELPGLPTAAITLTIAIIGEVLYLGWRTQQAIPNKLLGVAPQT